MSAIAGIFRFDGRNAGLRQIERITNAMAHRGPDDANVWSSGPVALGHRLLRTTPESLNERQPLRSSECNVFLVMDGRLDNREDLSRELRQGGPIWNDAEFTLAAYLKWGSDCPRHLLGDFAFAVWDGHQRELFCARDHFGARPFYYALSRDFFVFASEEEALLDAPEVSREVNLDRIAYLLMPQFHAFDFNISWVRDVRKLPPGTSFSVHPSGKVVEKKYWQVEPHDESRFASDLECEEAFRAELQRSISCRMRTLSVPGLMLSGGIDSASIAGGARNLRHRSLRTFSVVSQDETDVETKNILEIVAGYECDAHVVAAENFEGSSSLEDLKDAAWKHAHPAGNSIILPAMMYLASARAGCRVMFDGIDGDLAAFTPLRYHGGLLRSGAFSNAFAEARAARRSHTYLRQQSVLTILTKSAWDAFVPSAVKKLKWALGDTADHWNGNATSLLSFQFSKSLDINERMKEWRTSTALRDVSNYQEQHIRALMPVGLPRGLEGFDAVAGRYGIDPRHPWADKRLIEFFVRLPLKYKVREGWTKYLLRTATRPWLPHRVRWNKGKDHLGGRLVQILMKHSREQVMESLVDGEAKLSAYVDVGELRRLRCSYEKGANDEDLWRLYTLATLDLWTARLAKRADLRSS